MSISTNQARVYLAFPTNVDCLLAGDQQLRKIWSYQGSAMIVNNVAEIWHYENTPMQYTEIFFGCKNENFHWKNFDIFLIFAQNIDCGYMYTLEPPRRGGSNE